MDKALVMERFRKYSRQLPSNGLKSLKIDLSCPKNCDPEKHLTNCVDKFVGLACYGDAETTEFIAQETNRPVNTTFNIGLAFVINGDVNNWEDYIPQIQDYFHKANFAFVDGPWGIMREERRSDKPILKRDNLTSDDCHNCAAFLNFTMDPNGSVGVLFTTSAWYGTWLVALRKQGFQCPEQARYIYNRYI